MRDAPSDSQLREVLRAAGLRATMPRVSVLRALHSEGSPTTHAGVFASLAEHGWDRATLYRNLVDLTEAGLLRRVDLGDHVWRYELVSTSTGAHEDAEHPHFLCTACGDLACLPDVHVEIPTTGVPSAMSQGIASIQFRGVCDRCQHADGPSLDSIASDL
jgi:Fur family ferric uptake transcriptional regulator